MGKGHKDRILLGLPPSGMRAIVGSGRAQYQVPARTATASSALLADSVEGLRNQLGVGTAPERADADVCQQRPLLMRY